MILFIGTQEILLLLFLLIISIIIISKNKNSSSLPKNTSPRINDTLNIKTLNVSDGTIDIYSTLLFYVNHDGNKEGPYNLKQIKDYPLQKDTWITTNTLNGAWYRADQFECLKELFEKESYKINSDGEIIR